MAVTSTIEALEQQIEALKQQLAEARRAAGPEVVGEYTFRDAEGRARRLTELFGGKRDLIVVHNMGRSCPYCTLWADGFVGLTAHLSDRAAFVLSSYDPWETMRDFAKSRGWNFPVVSVAGTTFAKDMGYEQGPGQPAPGVSAFHMGEDGVVVRTGHAGFGPGDDFCALWPMLDLLKDGPGAWRPKYNYSAKPCCGGGCCGG